MNESHTALIVVDMQADYIGENSKRGCYSANLIDMLNERISAAAGRGETVVYVRNKGRRGKEPYLSPFAARLEIVSNLIVDKEKASVFSDVNLLNALKEKQIRNIEVVGIDGNCCVAASAIDAAKLGFSVAVPLRYVGVKNAERFAKTRERLLKSGVRVVD